MIKRGDIVGLVCAPTKRIALRYIVRSVHPVMGLQLISARKRVDHGLWVQPCQVVKILTLGRP